MRGVPSTSRSKTWPKMIDAYSKASAGVGGRCASCWPDDASPTPPKLRPLANQEFESLIATLPRIQGDADQFSEGVGGNDRSCSAMASTQRRRPHAKWKPWS